MKIIHTADWHIGQNFYEYDRKAEHLRFMEWLKKITKTLCVDVLMIAGDIFDSPNPSAESQKIYYTFLRDITNENPRLQVIIIAGNHDSAARLEAPNPLLEIMNVTTRGVIKHTSDGCIDFNDLIIALNGGGYCLAIPYLRQGDYPEAESYSKSVKSMYGELYTLAAEKISCKNGEFTPIIAMGHLHAAGAEISENDRSERTIIGGLEFVSSDTFPEGIAYTALGHLHRGQKVSGRDNIRYSGAPIPMSFAEKNNRQGVVYINLQQYIPDIISENPDIDNQTSDLSRNNAYNIDIERIDFEETVKLISITKEPAPLRDVLFEIQELPDGDITDMSPYLEIKVLITEPEPSMRHMIETALAGKAVRLARISAATYEHKDDAKTINIEELREISPMNMAEKVFGKQYGGEKMPESMKKLLHEVIQEVEQ